jgi:hypothetical protein
LRTLLLFVLIIGGLRAQAQWKLASTEPGNVFAIGQRVMLTAAGTGGSPQSLRVHVTTFGGKTITARAVDANGAIDLGVLPRGFYDVEVSDGLLTTRAPVVVLPPVTHPKPSRIATDAAHAWLVPPARLSEAAELLRRAGFGFVRERVHWGSVEPERGRFVWDAYDTMTDEAVRRGIHVYQVFHDSPAWSRSDGKPNRYPDDLRDLYNFAREAARHYHGRVEAWEVWNEADITMFSIDTGSEYAAFLKAAYLGFKAGDSSVKVLQVSYALPAERFARCLYANGTLPYFDIFNYHIYDEPVKYPERAEGHFARLADAGAPSYPVWLTEAGISLPAIDGTLTAQDRRRQAAFVAQSCAMSLASGTDRHFFFVFPHCLGGGIEYGVLDADLKPYPSYAALSTAVEMIGSADYVGRVRVPDAPSVQARLFESRSRSTLVIWNEGDAAQVTLPVASARCKVLDCVGAEHPTAASGPLVLTFSREPLYIQMPRRALKTDGGPRLAWKPSATARRERPSPVILRLRPPDETIRKFNEAYSLPPSTAMPIQVEVYNLGKRPCTGEVRLTVPPGWSIDHDRFSVTLLPMDRHGLNVKVMRPPLGASDGATIRAWFKAGTGEAATCSPVAVLMLTDAVPDIGGHQP